ncbi:MarR family transcriptional regulator [Oceanospirillum sp. D5]|uniref:MarR family transcriptional regulator n=1 Tax=Oceanospirillum sediminis TaxID=2760088 RepID=A0A839IQD8_9GAMM|nr:MarR family transcriptional regulator [Oceanospirillum sediminis]
MTDTSSRKQAFRLTSRLSDPLDLYEHLPFRMAVISNLLMLDRDINIRTAADLGPRELRVLLNVGSYMPISSADIAYQTRVDSYTVSRAVSVLHKKGYLDFEASPSSRRVKMLVLTGAGKALYEQISIGIDQRSERLTEILTEQELAEMKRMLALLEDRAEAILADQAENWREKEGDIPADQKELIRWRKKSHKKIVT